MACYRYFRFIIHIIHTIHSLFHNFCVDSGAIYIFPYLGYSQN